MKERKSNCCGNDQDCSSAPSEIEVVSSLTRRHFLSRSTKVTVGAVIANSLCSQLQAAPHIYGPITHTGEIYYWYYCCLTGSAIGSGSQVTSTITAFSTSSIDTDIDNDLANSKPDGWSVESYSHSGFKGTIPTSLKFTPTANAVVTRGSTYDPADCLLYAPSQSYNGDQPVTGNLTVSGTITVKKPKPTSGHWEADIPFSCSLNGGVKAENDGEAWFPGPKSEITYPCAKTSEKTQMSTKECIASGSITGKFKHVLEMAGDTDAFWNNPETGKWETHEVKLRVNQTTMPSPNLTTVSVALKEDCS